MLRGAMHALGVSAALVALAEMGDKTQLLSFLLAARLRRPWPIIAGITVATLANHALAGSVGVWIADRVDPGLLRWGVAIAFIAFGVWTLRPDRLDTDVRAMRGGIFDTTIVAFFLAEMGDKTQIATAVLAARYPSLAAVVAGTTLGMLVADVPVVLIGNASAAKIPIKAIRIVAALMFAALGIYTLLAVPVE
jgi:putative Ca2+/H+ antiporter (TMEM165/GDT1 family)